jgi:hypothetical protein
LSVGQFWQGSLLGSQEEVTVSIPPRVLRSRVKNPPNHHVCKRGPPLPAPLFAMTQAQSQTPVLQVQVCLDCDTATREQDAAANVPDPCVLAGVCLSDFACALPCHLEVNLVPCLAVVPDSRNAGAWEYSEPRTLSCQHDFCPALARASEL